MHRGTGGFAALAFTSHLKPSHLNRVIFCTTFFLNAPQNALLIFGMPYIFTSETFLSETTNCDYIQTAFEASQCVIPGTTSFLNTTHSRCGSDYLAHRGTAPG